MTLVGQTIGRYRILEQLGQGGMSVVYKGLDTALDREVAVKVLHPHLATKMESRRRLAREAKAVAKLHHPNILEIFDFSDPETGQAFLVTEYIRGKTLNEHAQAFPVDPPELGAMMVYELAGALAHAHEAGVIHRDIKPENVMIREDGVLKLMDFGIAKLLDRDERMTLTGALVGSPAHMAPEIIEGLEADAAADVFSLGTILYWLTTHSLPFVASNATATLKRILDGAYDDPRELNAQISDGLADILKSCLARSRAERYEDAGQLRHALEVYLTGLGLLRPAEELVEYFADPLSYRPALEVRLVDRLVLQAEGFVREKRPAKALGVLNQVLALRNDEPRARRLFEDLNRRSLRHKRFRGVLFTVGAATLIGTTTAGGYRAWRHHQRPTTTAPHPVAAVLPPPARTPEMTVAPAPPPPLESTAPPSLHPHMKRLVTLERAAVPVPAIKGVSTVSVQIQVRPFGFVQLDDGPRSPEALTQHTLSATPGKHQVTVSCEYCETTHELITVNAEGANVFPLPAQIKPGRISFRFTPADALVRIGAEERAVGDTEAHPFEVKSPRGALTFQHQVEYEIHRSGFRTEHRRVQIPPGKTTVVSGTLDPQ